MDHRNYARRRFIILGAVVATQIASGCATQGPFGKAPYFVDVSGIYVSEDQKKLVVITSDYHYIFDNPDPIIKSTSDQLHEYVSAKFGRFYVKATGEISGEYSLALSSRAPSQQRDVAAQIGYKQLSNQRLLQISGTLKGIRYVASDVAPGLAAVKLNNTYRILVDEEKSSGEKAGNILLSPVRIAAGGVLLIGFVVLLPVVFTVQCIRGCK